MKPAHHGIPSPKCRAFVGAFAFILSGIFAEGTVTRWRNGAAGCVGLHALSRRRGILPILMKSQSFFHTFGGWGGERE
jgi:hypothetical protein